MNHLHLSIRQKTITLFILIAVIPFAVSNIYWYLTAQDTLRKSAEQNITLATDQTADIIDNYFKTKLLGLLSHSQGAALLSNNVPLIEEDLFNLLLQDPDITSLTFANRTGQEVAKITKNGKISKNNLQNISNTEEFKAASFKFGIEYISPVIVKDKESYIKIAVPVVYPEGSQSLLTFSSYKPEGLEPGQVFGVLIGTISLNRIYQNVLDIHVGSTGYLYLTDSEGHILVHPDRSFIGENIQEKNDQVLNNFFKIGVAGERQVSLTPYYTRSINQVPVLSEHKTIERTRWVLIAEQPIAEVSMAVENTQRQTLILFVGALAVVLILSIIFSHALTYPIKLLVEAAHQIGKGNFDYQFSIHTADELETLGNAYKDMSLSLKQDRSSLIAEKNTLSIVLNNTTDGVVGLDKNYNIVFANKAVATMLNTSIETIEKRPFDSVMNLIDKTDTVTIEKLCASTIDGIHKLLLQTPNNQSKTIHLTVSKISAMITSPIRYILTIYDISKEQELEAMKLDFVSMAAHELRTPLTSVRGYLSVFIQENKDKLNDDQNMLLDRINISAQQLFALVESLLNVTRMERVGFTLNMKQTNWFTIVDKSISEVTPTANERKVQIKLTKPILADLPVTVDELRIGEVINNLLTNAIKYSSPMSDIEVKVENDEKEVRTYVTDHGPGIPKEAIPHLFTKFYRVPGKIEQTTRGTGLGLYICKHIVELHQGKIWVESVEGEGSTFAFSLPMLHNKV